MKQTAIVIDHENVWFGLAKLREKALDKASFLTQTSIDELVVTWNDYSQRYGKIVARLVVAVWDNQNEIGRQNHKQTYRMAGF